MSPLQQRVVPRGGPELYDSSSSDDGESFQAQTPNVALPDYAARYMNHKPRRDIQGTGTVLEGFSPVMIVGHQV